MPRLRYSLTGALAALSLSGLAALAYSAWFEPRRLAVRRYVLTVPDLPPALVGLRAAFLSDFHVGGSRLSDRVSRRAIETVVAAHPDLVFLGGDFYDRANMHDGGRIFAPLKALSGRMFAVLGNHDFRRGSTSADAIVAMLDELGVRVLRNESVCLPLRGEQVIISGVNDPYTRRADLPRALADIPDGERPLILLAHAPSIVNDLPIGAAGLVLTGHTHGGQIRLSCSSRLTPLDITFYADRLLHNPLQEYQRGFHWVRGSLLFVSTGLGMTRWPLRFRAVPQVVFFELTDQPADPAAPCDAAARYVRPVSAFANR